MNLTEFQVYVNCSDLMLKCCYFWYEVMFFSVVEKVYKNPVQFKVYER